MSATRYQDYTPRDSSAKAKNSAGFGQKFFILMAGLIGGGLIVLGAGWWLKTQLAEVFMVKQSVTIVLVDPQPGSQVGPWVLQLQPDSKKIVWVNLLPEKQTELFSGYGQYSVASVYPLLVIDKRPDAYIQASLGAIVGRLVAKVQPWSELKSWQQHVFAAQIQTAMNDSARRRLAIEPIMILVKLSWQKIFTDDLSYEVRMAAIDDFQTSLSWFWFTQQSRLRWQWSNELADLVATAPAESADCPIAVVNASESQGLAKQIGTLLTNTGYEVIRITAETDAIKDSALWLDPNQAANCQTVALSVGGAIPTTPSLKLNQEITARYRAPVVLVVGLDNAR